MISDNPILKDTEQIVPTSSTNLKNRVSKLPLSRKQPLLPLFEVISNAIHATEERADQEPDGYRKQIIIEIIRNGQEEVLQNLQEVDEYPIHSFTITDNGIGLNESNFTSFREFDSEKKLAIGGKGTGRLICLKAFQSLHIISQYKESDFFVREFEYKKTKEGFDKYRHYIVSGPIESGTIVMLQRYEKEYEKFVPRNITEIASQIITHFNLYFILHQEPEIIIRNQNRDEINLTKYFASRFRDQVLRDSFVLDEWPFEVFITKSSIAKSHKIHYCAHNRAVKDEAIFNYIKDLKSMIFQDDDSKGFYYEIYAIGPYFDNHVNEERTGFNFSSEDDLEENLGESGEISLVRIRKGLLAKTEELLSDVLQKARKEKLDTYLPIIRSEYPNYGPVVHYNRDKVERLPPGLSSTELDLALYEIEGEWKKKVKAEGVKLLDSKKDITTLDDYQKLYDNFLEEFNEAGQSDLARYVIHRRAVLDLLERLIELNEEERFSSEELVHSLFFPVKESGKTVTADKQNLWLLDERLTFNSFLASDQLVKSVSELGSDSRERMDILIKKEDIFDTASLFSEIKTPHESFTIIEFKKPMRDDYRQGDRKHDPIKQVRLYIEEIIESKIKVKGRTIQASNNTPFYGYIVADITPSLSKILKYEEFVRTPDGQGAFRFYNTDEYKAYIEVLPFQKIIKDSKQRNKILFDKLLLS